jgi:hypothetical protein
MSISTSQGPKGENISERFMASGVTATGVGERTENQSQRSGRPPKTSRQMVMDTVMAMLTSMDRGAVTTRSGYHTPHGEANIAFSF